MKKLAVVLTNLGGPDSLESVQPFLFNLFSDPAIINLPAPFRGWLARFISSRRTIKAQKIYEKLGGKSPLLENTEVQARALEIAINDRLPDYDVKVFIAMRYWHPLTGECLKAVQTWQADHVVLLPLYPQFSTTTTASSVQAWQDSGGDVAWVQGCYFTQSGFIKAYRDLIAQALEKTPDTIPVRLLFSAHGIPQKCVDRGDPYRWQVEQTVAAVTQGQAWDSVICYQSRVGPLKWLTPSLGDELIRAARDGVGVVVVPISFVSEHSETLVELDMDYRKQAQELGLLSYQRVPTVADHPDFIAGLADIVEARLQSRKRCDQSLCPEIFSQCGCRP
ncbi:MAG: ferrochelatase [Candidatus Paracaedibacteraceae bacterium]|nr:ferrochelatase [Candidatus Paracaedibacteraceae bacterium]